MRASTGKRRLQHRIVVVSLLAVCAAGASLATAAALSDNRVDPIAVRAQTRAASSRTGLPAPSATEFARIFVEVTNRFAEEHADRRRIGGADCVQPEQGRYMCSYASWVPSSPRRCHLMQARWSPRTASTITITLAGRVERCTSLREALDSL